MCRKPQSPAVEHLVNDGRHMIEAMGIAPADVNFACIPLSHSYALGNIVMPLLLQGTGVALRQSFNPSQVMADVESTGATIFPGVPFMFDRFRALDIDRLPAGSACSSRPARASIPPRCCGSGNRSGRKIHSLLRQQRNRGHRLRRRRRGDRPAQRRAADAGNDGRDPASRWQPARDAFSSRARRWPPPTPRTAPPVRTPTRPARTTTRPAAFVDGGFLTGDMGYFDEGGRLVLTGRVSPSINVAGLKVDPTEIERMLRALPGVADVRVMGASCDRRGQQLVAFIVSDQALTSVDIRQRCARMLSPHKIPRQFIFLDQLPLDARGKMDRRALEALAAAPASEPLGTPSGAKRNVRICTPTRSPTRLRLHAMNNQALQSPRCAWCRRWLISFGL